MELSFRRLAAVVDAADQLWEAASLVCFERVSLGQTELRARLADWSGAWLSEQTVARTIAQLRTAGLIVADDAQPGGGADNAALAGAAGSDRSVLTDLGRAMAIDIRKLIGAESASTGRLNMNRTSGQDPVDDDDSMILPHGRQPAGYVAPPWAKRRDARNGGTLDRTADSTRPVIDTSVPHPARRYNFWLGGKDHFEADRRSAEELEKLQPTARMGALENRGFQRRVVQFMAEAGVKQFLDIGTGIPAPDNTHEVAQAVDPTAAVVYVDNDPIVLTHARALLNSTREGRTAYLDADLRTPDKIIEHPELHETLDLKQPVGLLLIAVLHFVVADERVYDIVNRLVGSLAPGSYVAITHGTLDYLPPEKVAATEAALATGKHGDLRFRSHEAVSRFFDGLEFVPPGLVPVAEWRPTSSELPDPAHVGIWGGVGRVS